MGRTGDVFLNPLKESLREAQLKRMTPDQRKLYEAVNEVYSTYTARLSDKVAQFDGQDDLFHGVENLVTE